MADAWEVAERHKIGVLPDEAGGFVAGFNVSRHMHWVEDMLHGAHPESWAHADTAPLAICRAALLVVAPATVETGLTTDEEAPRGLQIPPR